MSSSLITVAGIVGKAADVAERLFERAKARTDEEGRVLDGALRRALTHLLVGVEQHATEPPVVFFRRYSDLWSVGFSQMACAFRGHRRLLCEAVISRGKLREVRAHMVLIPHRCTAALERSLRTQMATLPRGRPQEDKWFVVAVHECIKTARLYGRHAVLVWGEPVGPCCQDEDVIASLDATPAWLRGAARLLAGP